LYTGYNNVKTGRILAIIGIVLNLLYLIYVVWIFATIGMSGVMEMNQDFMEQYGL
jgi:hypothetical protein